MKAIFGGLLIVVLVAYSLGVIYQGGKKAERGGSSDAWQGVIGVVGALLVAFLVGQEYPLFDAFGILP